MKKAHINENNQLLGWYDEEIHTSIPAPNIEVTEEVWQHAIDNNHNKVNADGTTESADFRTEADVFGEAKTEKIKLIDSTTASDIELIVGDNNKQKDLLATYNYLLEQKLDSAITPEVTALMNSIKEKWFAVKLLKEEGNAREAQVQAMELKSFATLDEAIKAVEAV